MERRHKSDLRSSCLPSCLPARSLADYDNRRERERVRRSVLQRHHLGPIYASARLFSRQVKLKHELSKDLLLFSKLRLALRCRGLAWGSWIWHCLGFIAS
ncbi:hypothetical protein MPTK1_3g11620 [Marchantia polymorpha subsp. ruderalis]|uniref:Uncharacterized protein n=2 Tax=Marchantia polymorpha TaxID=3197 RepID=A0AAF6AZR9_MARPO|nr:hypothetical protein MARPO_0037s0035 [Marchantia polymorpha]BBN05253.1 hypothetical protein Mp_3g11620 [Marchantia polymorpha subsp. ruderalis]|eukprot:PTQ40852.1 hypothetical protein MARPO_0037s0035 [Marchantia polymorpha]